MMASKRTENGGLIIAGIFLIITAIILILIFLMTGQTTISGGHPNNVQDVSIKCESVSFEYPFFSYNNALNKKTTINLVFGDRYPRSASLIYELRYNSDVDSSKSEAFNHASMNKAIGAAGLNSVLTPNYSLDGASLRMSIYVSSGDFEKSKSFFLLEDYPVDVNGFVRSYESLGFTCISNK